MINLKCPEPETTPFFGDSVESSLGAMNEVHTQRGNQLEGNIPPPPNKYAFESFTFCTFSHKVQISLSYSAKLCLQV